MYSLNLKKPAFVIFPMAYANGSLHLGHLYVLTQLFAKAKATQHPDSKILFSYHLSGLPAVLFFEAYKKGDAEKQKLVANLFKSIGKPVQSLETLEDWFQLVISANNYALAHNNFEIDFTRTHTTGPKNLAYDSFVRWYLDYLKQQKLLYHGTYEVLWCDSCKQVVGDHDLKAGEDVTMVPLKKSITLGTITDNPLKVINKLSEGEIYYSQSQQNYWELAELDYLSLKYILKLVPHPYCSVTYSSKTKDFEYLALLGFAICRCNTKIAINKISQVFLDYNNSNWKQKTIEKLKTIKISSFTKTEMLRYITELKGWPIFRSRGYGTDFLGKKLDPLTDSTLFFYFSILANDLENRVYPSTFWEHIFVGVSEPSVHADLFRTKFRNYLDTYDIIEGSGKDLTKNHLIFVLFTITLLNLPLTEIFTVGHVMLNGQKMSKSSGHYIDTLTLPITGYNLRHTLLTLSEERKDGDYTTKHTVLKEKELQFIINYHISEPMPTTLDSSEFNQILLNFLKIYENLILEKIEENKFNSGLQKITEILQHPIIKKFKDVPTIKNVLLRLRSSYLALIGYNKQSVSFQLCKHELDSGNTLLIFKQLKNLLRDLIKFKTSHVKISCHPKNRLAKIILIPRLIEYLLQDFGYQILVTESIECSVDKIIFLK